MITLYHGSNVEIERYSRGFIDVDRLIEELRYNGSRAIQYFLELIEL